MVLEVGCCGGTTTSIIGKHCRLVVGIDQTAAEIAIANRRFALPGKVRFEVMDAFDMAAVLRLQKDIGCQFTKVFIDINGSRDIGTICDCMDKIQKVLRPELVVVKSVKLRTLLYQCTAWDARGTESLAGEEREEERKEAVGRRRVQAGDRREDILNHLTALVRPASKLVDIGEGLGEGGGVDTGGAGGAHRGGVVLDELLDEGHDRATRAHHGRLRGAWVVLHRLRPLRDELVVIGPELNE